MSLKQDVRDALEWSAVTLGADALAGWLVSRLHPDECGQRVSMGGRPATHLDEDDLSGETPDEATARRLRACELHLTDLEERLTDRGVFSDG